MGGHTYLMEEYRPAIGDTLTYPVSSNMPNVESWNRLSEGEIEPTDKILWADSGKNLSRSSIARPTRASTPTCRPTLSDDDRLAFFGEEGIRQRQGWRQRRRQVLHQTRFGI